MSLDKDRRNVYGENDKASRKNIPRAKARVNRVNRRLDTMALAGAIGEPDDVIDDEVEQTLLGRRRKVWRKWPDEPLGRNWRNAVGTRFDRMTRRIGVPITRRLAVRQPDIARSLSHSAISCRRTGADRSANDRCAAAYSRLPSGVSMRTGE
jgi:hypothetical protein